MSSWVIKRSSNGERLYHAHRSGAGVVELTQQKTCYPIAEDGKHLSLDGAGLQGRFALWRAKRMVVRHLRQKRQSLKERVFP
jgi:hypothetical protein